MEPAMPFVELTDRDGPVFLLVDEVMAVHLAGDDGGTVVHMRSSKLSVNVNETPREVMNRMAKVVADHHAHSEAESNRRSVR